MRVFLPLATVTADLIREYSSAFRLENPMKASTLNRLLEEVRDAVVPVVERSA
jgi:hypothetical protein